MKNFQGIKFKIYMSKNITLFLLALIFVSNLCFGQDKGKDKKSKNSASNLTYVSADAKLKKSYTAEDLKPLGKIQLVEIYMERISVLTELLPYIALKSNPGATLYEMGIPETPQNVDHMVKEVKNKESYLSAVKNTLDDIIPYADKTNIIWAILFIEDTIKNIESAKGKDYSVEAKDKSKPLNTSKPVEKPVEPIIAPDTAKPMNNQTEAGSSSEAAKGGQH